MPKESKWVASCCLAVLLALCVAGAVSHGMQRIIVQTLPLWVSIVLGFRGSEFAKWSALPCLIIWLASMIIIWLFLLRFVHFMSGRFSSTEIAMSIVVGAASASGFAAAVHWRTGVRPYLAGAVALLFGALQFFALWITVSHVGVSRT
jgi:hypothetical protein